eukprot:1160144-Pelagomonas_calceolata.AAC.8
MSCVVAPGQLTGGCHCCSSCPLDSIGGGWRGMPRGVLFLVTGHRQAGRGWTGGRGGLLSRRPEGRAEHLVGPGKGKAVAMSRVCVPASDSGLAEVPQEGSGVRCWFGWLKCLKRDQASSLIWLAEVPQEGSGVEC